MIWSGKYLESIIAGWLPGNQGGKSRHEEMEPEKRIGFNLKVKVLDPYMTNSMPLPFRGMPFFIGKVFVSFHLCSAKSHLGKGTMFTASFLRSAFN